MSNVTVTSFSSIDRQQHMNVLQSEYFDLIVIGGGATGCGIALDAAARGMKTALVEKEDFASGTSSKSTKLIHGGLRYLKQLEIGLVNETGTERAIVHRLAPHLVVPEKMLMPIVEGGTYGKWAASFGVMVYDILAGVKGDDKRKMLNKKETLKKEPLLNADSLKGGCYYAEYRTDDSRLCIELAKTSVSHGCIAINYCEVADFIYQNGQVKGIKCKDLLGNKEVVINAQQVVSATGPWVDELRKVDQSLQGKRLHLTKGVHIVLSHDKLPLKQSIYFDVPDGRMIFAIPRGRATYVGTTDTNYKGNKDRVVATKEDADYLLKALNHIFPSVPLTIDDIESNWAGLRPLIHEEGKSPSELSRRDEIFESKSGLISIAGGKLTGYRKMAQRIVDIVDERLDKNHRPCTTKTISLGQKPMKTAQQVQQYIKLLEGKMANIGLTYYHAWYLATTYGKQADILIDKMMIEKFEGSIGLARAEVWYGVHHEMVNSMEDFFVRRTGRLFFYINSIHTVRDDVTSDIAKYLNWDKKKTNSEIKRLNEHLHDATFYYEKELT
ncbi:MAG: glycerol-3-phosphate dehydrogenase/oxidase [Saprospiraceae bacterium]